MSDVLNATKEIVVAALNNNSLFLYEDSEGLYSKDAFIDFIGTTYNKLNELEKTGKHKGGVTVV